jgi:hypothetical protein
MGIRFFCPNGHKLNVKEFQAGRRGICPFCGARIQIPTQSTRPSSKSIRRHGAAHATTRAMDADDAELAQASDSSPEILPGEPPSLPGDPAGGRMLGPSTPVGIPSGSHPVVAPPTLPPVGQNAAAIAAKVAAVEARPGSVRPASPAPSLPSAPGTVKPIPAAPVPVAVAPAAAPTPPAAAPVPSPPAVTEPADPIAEAPDMIWYVRPPSGGQFGPASGELMRTWLSEGRVGVESLVWREGWRDWQEAGKVFPKLRGSQIMDFLEAAPVVNVAAAPAVHAHRPKVAQTSDRSQIALLVVLSLAVIVLFIVFVFVLFH